MKVCNVLGTKMKTSSNMDCNRSEVFWRTIKISSGVGGGGYGDLQRG